MSKKKRRSSRRRTRVLVGPSHDRVTRVCESWVRMIENSASGVDETLYAQDANADSFADVVKKRQGQSPIIVFFGHGEYDALLTSGDLGWESELYGGTLGRLADIRTFPRGCSVSLVAYSCRCGVILGEQLSRRDQANDFLGFTDRIYLVLGTEQRERAFLQPVSNAAIGILDRGYVRKNEGRDLRARYEQERANWDEKMRDTDDESLLVSMFLGRHAESVVQH